MGRGWNCCNSRGIAIAPLHGQLRLRYRLERAFAPALLPAKPLKTGFAFIDASGASIGKLGECVITANGIEAAT